MANFLSAVSEVNWSHDSRARFINAMEELRRYMQPWEADILVWTILAGVATERGPTADEQDELRLGEPSEEMLAFLERSARSLRICIESSSLARMSGVVHQTRAMAAGV